MGQRLGAFEGPVGYRDRLRVLRGEVRRRELDHLARAHEQDVLLIQVAENPLRDPDGGGRHGHRLRPDFRGGPDFLGDGECPLEEVIQQQSEPAGVPGQLLCLLHLAKNLRLPEHHRVESARHPEGVPDRCVVRQHVRMPLEFVDIQLLFRGDEALERPLRPLRLLHRAVQLCPVAGGDDRRLGKTATGRFRQRLAQPTDGRADLVRDERDPLAHGKRRGRVVQAQCQQLHRGGAGVIRRAGHGELSFRQQIIGFMPLCAHQRPAPSAARVRLVKVGARLPPGRPMCPTCRSAVRSAPLVCGASGCARGS
jgi:hypothetical protein